MPGWPHLTLHTNAKPTFQGKSKILKDKTKRIPTLNSTTVFFPLLFSARVVSMEQRIKKVQFSLWMQCSVQFINSSRKQIKILKKNSVFSRSQSVSQRLQLLGWRWMTKQSGYEAIQHKSVGVFLIRGRRTVEKEKMICSLNNYALCLPYKWVCCYVLSFLLTFFIFTPHV